MNFISSLISLFVVNTILTLIINALPIRNKRNWQIGVITLVDIGSIIGYAAILFQSHFDLLYLLSTLGNILGELTAYVASMMLILEDVKIFKSRRLRQFERDINNKSGRSLPRNILALICFIIFVVLLTYTIISFINYNETILVSLIGSSLGVLVALGLGIYFLISGLPQHKSIKAENILFIINTPTDKIIFEANLNKEFTIDDALGKLYDTYIIDEYGLIVTPTNKYIVKGIKINKFDNDLLAKIQMTKDNDSKFKDVILEFQKYNRKKIILDENNKIVKISNIK